MSNQNIPGWLGPILRPIIGAVLGMRAVKDGDYSPGAAAGMGAMLGLGAGLIIWFLDWRSKKR